MVLYRIINDCESSVSVWNRELHELPVVISMPHSGVCITDRMGQNLKSDAILANMDWYLPELYDFLEDMGFTVVINRVSRYVIDPNRELTGGKQPDYTKALIYEKTTFGRDLYQCTLSEKEELEWRTQYDKCNVNGGLNKGQDSHMAIDYDLVLSEGVLGMIRKIDANAAQTPDPEKKNFYGTCKRCLEGVLVHAHHYADKALELSRETDDPARKEELLRLADICRRVPAHPASTFYEAVQSVHFITHCITRNPFRPNNNQFQLGHPDRYLWPYYEKDIRDGVITKEAADLALSRLEVDALGLDNIDRRMLTAIIQNYGGGPVGLETLAATIGEEAVTLEDVYEPYLMQLGFLTRTPRGRCVTALAYEHLHIPYQAQFSI